MRQSLLLAATAGLAMFAAGGAFAATSVQIKDAAARVIVIPENRADVKVEVAKSHPRLPLGVRTEGDKVIVDGGLGWNKIRGCSSNMGRTRIRIAEVGEVGVDDLPQIIVHTPMNAKVGAGGAVFGSVGRTDSLELSNGGCGDWTVANVKGALRVNDAGSGDVRTGSAGSVEVHVGGSGDIQTRDIAGPATIMVGGSGDVSLGAVGGDVSISVGGSGDITVARVSAPVKVKLAGSGDINLGGHTPNLEVSLAGSGDVSFHGVADSVKASIAGSGDVHVDRVTGPVTKSVVGSGSVYVGR